MIKSDLLNKKYYLDRMSMFLKESYGISNSSGTGQLDILLMIMNSFNNKEKGLLELLDVMDYDAGVKIEDVAELLDYENKDSFYASTNCPFLDTIASIIGISRNISFGSQDLTLDNKDLITYIKFTVCNSNFNGSLGDLIDKYSSSGIDCAIKINGDMSNTINFLVDQFDDARFVNFILSGHLLPNIIGVDLDVHIVSQDYIQVRFENATATLEIGDEVYELVSGEIFGLANGMKYTLTVTANDGYYFDALNGFEHSGNPTQITTSAGVNGDHYKEYKMTDTAIPDDGKNRYTKEIDLTSSVHKYYTLTFLQYNDLTNSMRVSDGEFIELESLTQYVSENTGIYMKHVVSGEGRYVNHTYKKSLIDTELSSTIPVCINSIPTVNTTDYFQTLVTKEIIINSNMTLNVHAKASNVITFNSRVGGSLKFGNLDVPKSGASYNFLPISTGPVITYNWQNQYIFKSGNLPTLNTIGRTEVYNNGVLNNEITSFTTQSFSIASTGDVTFNLNLEKVSMITIEGTNGYNAYDSANRILFADTQTFDHTVTRCDMRGIGGSGVRRLYYIGFADIWIRYFSFIKTDSSSIVEYYYGKDDSQHLIPNECKSSGSGSKVINLDKSTLNNVPMKDSPYADYESEDLIRDSFYMNNNDTYAMSFEIYQGYFHDEDVSINIVYKDVKTAYLYVEGWSDYTGRLYIEDDSHYVTHDPEDPWTGENQTLCIASPDETLGELGLHVNGDNYRLTTDSMSLPGSSADNTTITYVSVIED